MSLSDWLELTGLFAVALLAPNINFFLPVRPTILTILLAQHMPWLLVGIVGTVGGVIGTLPLYGVAYKATDTKMVQRWLRYRPVKWILDALKGKLFLLIVVLVMTPLPDQLIGLTAGTERYSVRKFLLANCVGRALVYLPLSYLASRHAAAISDAWTWFVHLLTI